MRLKAADGGAGPGPAGAAPVTVRVPVIACGCTSQWNLNVPGSLRVMDAFVPAKRPASAPGMTIPVSNEPSSAVSEWGLPPTLANWSVEPAFTVSVSGTNRRRSPVN